MLSDLTIRVIPFFRPLRWLALGWRDFLHSSAGLVHGLAVAAIGAVIALIGWHRPALLPGAFSGFVLVAPLIATGLYEFSRRLERGDKPGLADALAAWQREGKPLVQLGLLLLLMGTLWVGVSMAMLGSNLPADAHDLASALRGLLASVHPFWFLAWIVLGGTGAAIVFGLTAISMPMLLDRDIRLSDALLTSVKTVGDNPAAMAFWAALIMTGVMLGMATFLLGLIVIVPVFGHATWHAYRDLVDASALPTRL